MTNFTPSPEKLLATETPCLGSEASSPYDTTIFWPRMPPAALMSAAAWSTPFFICAPVAALGPVMGPPTPNLVWAEAVWAAAIATLRARPNVVIFFISHSPSITGTGIFVRRNPMSGQSAAPAHQAVGLVKPAILCDHLPGAGGLKTQVTENDAERAVHEVIVERKEGAAIQAEMYEPNRPGEDEAVCDNLPPWPPGCRNGAASENCCATTENYGDQHEDA